MGIAIVCLVLFAVASVLLLAVEIPASDGDEIIVKRASTKTEVPVQKYHTPEEVAQKAELLMVLHGDFHGREDRKLDVYLDEWGRAVLVDQENKTIGQLSCFYVKEIKYDVYRYHGAKNTYTGVTVGRVHTGGLHTEGAHYTVHSCHSGNGPLCCTVGGKEYQIKYIIIPDGFFLEQVKNLLRDERVHSNRMTLGIAVAKVIKTRGNKMLEELFGPNKNVIPLVNWEGKDSEGHTMLGYSLAQGGNTYMAAEQFSRADASEFNPISLNKRIGEVIVQAIASL